MAEVQALDQHTGGAIGPSQFEVKESTHSTFCVPSVAVIGRAQARKLVEETVFQGTSTLPQAIGNAVTLLRNQYGDLEAAQFPTVFQLQRGINKQVNRFYGHSPSSFQGLTQIPRELGVTKRGDEFLLVFESYFDRISVYAGIIIVFATTSDLRKLFSKDLLVADGTFKIKPAPWARVRGAQVFTLNTIEGVYPSKRLFPRVLALLPQKSEHCLSTFLHLTFHAAVSERGIDLSIPGCINPVDQVNVRL